jgi:glycosyltransferase involved in cell wall biosynthesis
VTFELRLLYWAFFSKKKKPEVIIVSSLSLLTFLSGCILKKYFKCRLICEVRDIWPLTLVEAKKWSKNNIFIRCLSLIEKHGYNKADIIIGSMQNLIEHIKNVSPDNAGKVHYIPMGFEPDVWSEKNNYHDFSFLDSLSQKGFFKVGYAGSMSNLDCIDEIIEAASILKNRPITFFLLGDGEQKEKFVALAEKYNLTSLYFLDRVKKSEVHSFLLHCDLLLSPWKDINSVYKYGVSPNKWIDYMLSAKPILVSLNGPHCIINEAGCGRFIKSGNPEELSETILEFSLMSRKELETMGNNGKSYLYQNLTYNILSEKYLNIIDNIALI